jgi:hypothetical protein
VKSSAWRSIERLKEERKKLLLLLLLFVEYLKLRERAVIMRIRLSDPENRTDAHRR